MAKATEIADFGEKIGGARKDLAQFRKLGGFGVDDIGEWSDIERDKHIVKKEVFVKPDYQALYDTGDYSKEALFFQQQMYKALPPKPYLYPFTREARENGRTETDGVHAGQEAYIRIMNKFREMLSNVKTTHDVLDFDRRVQDFQKEHNELFSSLGYDGIRKMNRNFVTSSYSMNSLIFKMNKDQFLYTEDEKKLSDAAIVKYDGKNLSMEYYIKAEVEGIIPLEGRTTEEVEKRHSTGLLRNPEYRTEGDHLIVTGTYINHQTAKNKDDIEVATTRFLSESTDSEYYKPLGALQDISVKNVEIEESRQSRFVLKTGGGSRYFYNQDENPCADVSKYEEGKYVVIVNAASSNGSPIDFNIESLEEAKKVAIQFAEVRDAARKAVKEGKTKLLPPQLKHVQRIGEDYLDGGNVEVKQKIDSDGKPIVKLNEQGSEVPAMECPAFETELGFRAGEFGNWENQDDRRTNLNMAYESFRDMTKALGIAESDASLGKDLAIAFGSRGKGGSAIAHFEPASNVINITKMRGAGSLGHEWGHALDYAIARTEGRTVKSGKGWLETDFAHSEGSLLHGVMNAMKYTPEGNKTKFFKDAQFIDGNHSKSDKGYWQSNAEMFARAFHTYLLDKLKSQEIRNDYLCGHAEYPPEEGKNGELHFTYPLGEERERINGEFDKLIEALKERGIFHEQGIDKKHELVHSQDGVKQEESLEQMQEIIGEQLEFDLTEPKTTKKKVRKQAEKEAVSASENTQTAEKAEEKKGWGNPQPKNTPQEKGHFTTTPNLNQLEETMREHKPFTVMAMSTSGLKDAEPIRVVVQEYVFDDELKKYEKGLGFDEMVKCSQEQLNKMLTSTDYDYFGNAGIDKDSYVRGEGVLSKEDFSKEFVSFMKTLEQGDKELMIINGGKGFAEEQLSKVSPEAQQAILDKVIDRSATLQPSLTYEYFKKHDIKGRATLENLRDAITPSPSGSFRDMLMEGSPRMDDFNSMSKEEFCKTANVTPYQYDMTKRDFELREGKIVGADGRVDMIARFTEVYGREKGVLESERDSQWREADVLSRREMSEKGKEKYRSDDYEQKLATLVSSHVINPEAVLDRNSDCELNKFLNVMEKNGVDGESHNKGFVVIQAATTGFDYRSVGEPIQVSAIAFNLGDDGSITPAGGISEYGIKASDKAIENALKTAKRGKFDAFEYSDINVDEYLSGKGVHSKEETMKELSAFFKQFPSEDYPIISNGTGKNDPALTLTQESFLALGSAKAFSDSHNSVDFTQVIKEYSYAAYHKEGVESVVAKEDEVKAFGLADVVAANTELSEALKETQGEGMSLLGSTLQKVNATAILADSVRMQDMELHRPELFAALQAQEQAQNVAENEVQPSPTPQKEEAEHTRDTSDKESVPVISPYEESESVEQDFSESVDIADILDDPSEATVEDTREHGNLYSDKKSDTRDVVIVEGDIKKIAEVEIPHVSEAAQESSKEQGKPKEEPSHRMIDRQREHRRRREEKPKITSVKTETSTPEKPSAQATDREAELIAIVKSQQEMMRSMQNEMKAMREELSAERAMNHSKENTISLFSKQLTRALEKQTELMAQIAGVPSQEASKDYKSMTPTERVDAIEQIKDEIVKIKETVATGSRESLALSNANMQLCNAQKQIDKERLTPNKAG